jgi:hypothetical protein
MTEGKKVYLLVANKKLYNSLLGDSPQDQCPNIIDVNDFVLQHRDLYPELDNFLGFDSQEDD